MEFKRQNDFNSLRIIDLGYIDYEQAWKYQTDIHQQLIEQKRNNPSAFELTHCLILCEHPHVYTLGKSGKEENLVIDSENLASINASFHKINRGGDITYHGPGQLVAYPILDLDKLFTDVHRYVRTLEECIIKVLEQFKLNAERIEGLTGVWLDKESKMPRKICAIGVHLSRWVSLHGLAFNVNSDLNYFNHIIPCGISSKEKTVSSLEKELGYKVNMEDVKNLFTKYFLELFELKEYSL